MIYHFLNKLKNLLTFLIVLFFLSISNLVFADKQFLYRVLLDTDNDISSGCNFDTGSSSEVNNIEGFEKYIQLTMQAPGESNQFGLSGSFISCSDGSWDVNNPAPISEDYWSSNINEITTEPDSVDVFFSREDLGDTETIRIVVQAYNSHTDSTDVLSLQDGQPILFSLISNQNVPFLPPLAFFTLSVVLFLSAKRSHHLKSQMMGLVFIAGVGSALYINEVESELNDACSQWGWCMDWSQVPIIAIDDIGDTSDSAVDIQSIYMAEDINGLIGLRIDLKDVTNACLSLSPCDINASCTNQSLGVWSCSCLPDYSGDGVTCAYTPNGDSDSDGIDELLDNCPLISNPLQSDKDEDGIGDVCDQTPNPFISLSVISDTAIEKSQQAAEVSISRSAGSGGLSINYSISGNPDLTRGSAIPSDYQLVYEDGSAVGQKINFSEGQSTRNINIIPINDGLHEVPETLVLSLVSGADYDLNDSTLNLKIIDASNNPENSKVFFGVFLPQGDAVTSGSGVLSLILDGDNDNASLNYNFSNLSAVQTDQHIHIAPSGTIIKDVHHTGSVYDLAWDLAPAGFFTTEQEMLDALFDGLFYLNIHTSTYPGGEISAVFTYDSGIEPPEETELTAADVDRDIIRFLTQATFGATPEDYQELRNQITEDGSNRIQVYNDWIDQQISLDSSSMFELMESSVPLFSFGSTSSSLYDYNEPTYKIRRDAFWPIAIYGKDQLRQRMAFALSQILVISDQQATIRKADRGTSKYWDQLAENAFSFYNDTLLDVSKSPIMGTYLSHLRNQKSDPVAGTFPDENFAREIMQLFSFGLVHRKKNGEILLGPDNLPISTYDNNVIREMARVFTGLAHSYRTKDGALFENNWFQLGDLAYVEEHRWTNPMKFFTNQHDYGEKILFTDNGSTIVVPANNNHSVENAEQELRFVIDAIVAHQTTAPFISRQLIQRFVTSNPSPAYIERVSNSFGEKGDLTSVIKAILLDPEARNPNVASSVTFGKVKEPVLQLTATMRLLQVSSGIPFDDTSSPLYPLKDKYDPGASLLRMNMQNLGQYTLGATSVFNFYLPDFSPSGEMSGQSLVAPEMQLMTESQLFTTMNNYNSMVNGNRYFQGTLDYSNMSAEDLKIKLSDSRLQEVADSVLDSNQAKAEAMVDYLDFYLNAGKIKYTNNTAVRDALVQGILSATDDTKRFKDLIYAINVTPDFIVQQ